ncbi:MAG: heparinase II/III family protein [Anaerolineae bacterium]|nr:heparinase II/III family protein [Anaerolineae bacterium]
MLADRYGFEDVRRALVSPMAWAPFPTIENREAWEALRAETRDELVAAGKAKLGTTWPVLPATLFLEYARVGNRSNYEWQQSYRRSALRDLVLAECVEAEGRFLDDIVNVIWATCEETYWGYPAHVDAQRAGAGLPDVEEPTVDLFAAETVALLAWTHYLLGDRLDTVSPLVRRRIGYETRRRVLGPCLARDDFWWMGFDPAGHGVNNWNPWVNSNWLTAVLLLETDDARRVQAVRKILRSLDIFVETYAESGGCDEGPGYWGRAAASLFDCLDLLQSASDGAIDVFGQTKIRNMGRYIYRVQIDDDYYTNFADASAINRPNAALVLRYGLAIEDEAMMAFGAWLMAKAANDGGSRGDSIGRVLPALFRLPDPLPAAPRQPRPRDVWFEGIQVMVARDQAGAADGLFVAAKAGHNGESHNHNDVGNVIIFMDGRPLIVDAGVETYRRQTFSPQRYEIWTMQSAYHTLLPAFDGVMQAPGEHFAARSVAYAASENGATLSLDLAGAYPPEAGVASWIREVTLRRGEAVVISDSYKLNRPVTAIALSLLTPSEVAVTGDGMRFRTTTFGPEAASRVSGSGCLAVPQEVSSVTVERVRITDARLGGVWGDGLNRVVFTVAHPEMSGTWRWRVSSE